MEKKKKKKPKPVSGLNHKKVMRCGKTAKDVNKHCVLLNYFNAEFV